MARTVKEIKDSITAMWIAQVAIQARYGLNANMTFDEQFSPISIESIKFYVQAFCAWTIETLFDLHRAEMEALYKEHHAHTLNWYNSKAISFMFGYPLTPFTSNYDTSNLTDEEIAAALIVKHASCVKVTNNNGVSFLRLKVAKQNGSLLEKLSSLELTAFADYMGEIQDAGVDLLCTSNDADYIKMTWEIFYDPQILDGAGNRLDGSGSDVVRSAIKEYVQTLPFNGLYVPAYHIDYLQKVAGVMVPEIGEVFTHPELSLQYTSVIADGKVADAGYFKFYDESDLVVILKPFTYGENL